LTLQGLRDCTSTGAFPPRAGMTRKAKIARD
jgi:hypothetical protein